MFVSGTRGRASATTAATTTALGVVMTTTAATAAAATATVIRRSGGDARASSDRYQLVLNHALRSGVHSHSSSGGATIVVLIPLLL